MTKVNCLNKIAACGTNLLNGNYEMTSEFAEADAVLVRSAAMHEMELPKNLKCIARAGAGVNNIPLDKCAEEGIVVFNTPGANANGVKEAVILGLLLASRDVLGGVEWIKTVSDKEDVAKLVEKEKSKFAGKEIQGRRLGVIGLGAIGVLVANAANRLGMKVYGYDPYISVEHAWNLSRDIIHVKTKEEIFKKCDYISIHVPLNDSTKYMINKDSISMMKNGAVVLNYARDLLVNDEDMEIALKNGKISKYVTDFPNAKSVNMPGTIAIPHLGASTAESEDNCAVMAVKQTMDYIDYGIIRNSVNYPNCDAGVCEADGRITICHRNIPSMLTQFTTVLSDAGINIANLINKSRGDYAYSVFDIEAQATEEIQKKLEKIDGVLKVRIIK